jgi:hypothetical protein
MAASSKYEPITFHRQYYITQKSNNSAWDLYFLYRYAFSLLINTKDANKTLQTGLFFSTCPYYYYMYSALQPVWAETRAQSGDWTDSIPGPSSP